MTNPVLRPNPRLEIPQRFDRRKNVVESLAPEEVINRTDGPVEDDWRVIHPVPSNTPVEIPHHKLGKPSAKWSYRDRDGRLLFIVCRFETDGGKQIVPLNQPSCKAPQHDPVLFADLRSRGCSPARTARRDPHLRWLSRR